MQKLLPLTENILLCASALWAPNPGSDPDPHPGSDPDRGSAPHSGPGPAVPGRFYCPDPCEPRPTDRTSTSDGASSHRTSTVRKDCVSVSPPAGCSLKGFLMWCLWCGRRRRWLPGRLLTRWSRPSGAAPQVSAAHLLVPPVCTVSALLKLAINVALECVCLCVCGLALVCLQLCL